MVSSILGMLKNSRSAQWIYLSFFRTNTTLTPDLSTPMDGIVSKVYPLCDKLTYDISGRVPMFLIGQCKDFGRAIIERRN